MVSMTTDSGQSFVWEPCLVGSPGPLELIDLALFHYCSFQLETDSLAPAMFFQWSGLGVWV